MPHGHCYFWKPEIMWSNVAGDAMIALAYFTLPPMLFYLARKRADLTHRFVFVLFGLFIFFCGFTHVIDIWTIWIPTYRFEGTVKILTGILSLATAFVTLKSLPVILALPSRTQLEETNQALFKEIADRKRAEDALAGLNQQLEKRVKERTTDLVTINQELEKQVEQRRQAQTELQAKNRQLLLANNMLDSFIYSASHELKVPLVNIEGLLDALKDELPGTETNTGQIVQHLNSSITKTRNIAQGLSDYTRISQQLDTTEAVELEIMAQDLITNFQEEINTANAVVETDFSQAPVLYMPPFHLRVVLSSLLTNALLHRQPGQDLKIRISSENKNAYTVIAVSDNGTGTATLESGRTSPGNQPKSQPEQPLGSGMSLQMVRRIVENNAGYLEVDSREGSGTTFFVYLPAQYPHHA